MAKGGQYERDLCRELSLWWTSGERDDVFWRTSQSGGRATTRTKTGKRTHGQYGDIQATDPIGLPLVQLATIEAKKGYSGETAFNSMDRMPVAGREILSQWEAFIKQAESAAKASGTPYWILVHKRDKRRAMVFMPVDLYWDLCHNVISHHECPGLAKASPYMMMKIGDIKGRREFYATTLDAFKSHVRPDQIRQLASRGKRQLVVMVRRVVPSFTIRRVV